MWIHYRGSLVKILVGSTFGKYIKAPHLIACSGEAAALPDLDDTAWQTELFCSVFSGSGTLPNKPLKKLKTAITA